MAGSQRLVAVCQRKIAQRGGLVSMVPEQEHDLARLELVVTYEMSAHRQAARAALRLLLVPLLTQFLQLPLQFCRQT